MKDKTLKQIYESINEAKKSSMVISSDGTDWTLVKMDDTHFKIGSRPYHVGELKKHPNPDFKDAYDNVVKWLNESKMQEGSIKMSDLMYVKDQLINAWEDSTPKEMINQLSRETSLDKKGLSAFVKDWFDDDRRRNSVLMAIRDNGEFEDWFSDYL